MNSSWWTLPGPSVFCKDIADELKAGRNVLVMLPEMETSGLLESIASKLREESLQLWKPDLDPASSSRPVTALLNLLVPDKQANLSPAEDPYQLLQDTMGFAGRIFRCCPQTREELQAWLDYIENYNRRFRNLPLMDQTFVLVVAMGLQDTVAIQSSTDLRVFEWNDVVREIDSLIFADLVVPRYCQQPSVCRKLAVYLCAGLALWDGELAEYLSSRDLKELMKPAHLLIEYADLKGWGPDMIGSDRLKEFGLKQCYEGRAMLHSSLVAMDDSQKSHLERRVWKAQASVLLPWLEFVRMEVLEHLETRLRLPWQSKSGAAPIENLEDLELNHISHQLRTALKHLDRDLARWCEWLTGIRNNLAHFKPLPPKMLGDYRWFRYHLS